MRLLFCILFLPSLCLALEPDQLVLIANSNVPQGHKLAEYYAQQRGVPDHRILDLNLPTGEEISADKYDRDVAPAVRAFLKDNGLEKKVTCLVTFYGVPIRVGNRVNSEADKSELAAIEEQLHSLPTMAEPAVDAIEKLAAEVSSEFAPLTGNTVDALYRRAEHAMNTLTAVVAKTTDVVKRQQLEARGERVVGALVGPMGLLQRAIASQRATTQPATRPIEQYLKFRHELTDLDSRPFDAESRQKLRDLVARNLGPFDLARVLHMHADALQTADTSAAFDSELSLIWLTYPRSRWIPNPLHYSHRAPSNALMVMRLDAPQSGEVSQMINASLLVEKRGLRGKIVIDSRGLPATGKNGHPDPYGQYDQGLRDLAELIETKAHGKISMLFDDRPEVLPAHSARNVALYMGWYSVDKYVPACEFVPGAVGFHLASFTMATLRHEDGRAWARNLLEDGISATLGAVDEPFLQSFPPADEFFPLLLTGKLTLAEVYWKTVPWSSWRICMIGDPLYRPYAVNPVLNVDDLPARLRPIFNTAGR